MIPLEPDDRVLFLSIPPPRIAEQTAISVPRGIVVILADREQIYDTRARLAHLENVMVVPATPDEIPWQDGFFSRIVDALDLVNQDPQIAREVKRVLSEGGRILES